ncbi:hypothetical protein Tc00.1047053509039.40 [Trypanosoma cruzi]|uniref:Uncharacterized protein n=1 Tax=Trypanosoma cruzi (strain CL Brener) TaxID=353153 RepID=Q4CU41_TRYCC|nr:hypothetical protein Tc00.1047053509039.40 [Trypanosoma cruzi]EAN83795.1 hypothetical protein Tc00.1047053509039.40 [Trypanosoma cruzi]|eukprot:XP_805646.1 hypothetical protein [Trypanosoma cruzi strain CL Brener]
MHSWCRFFYIWRYQNELLLTPQNFFFFFFSHFLSFPGLPSVPLSEPCCARMAHSSAMLRSVDVWWFFYLSNCACFCNVSPHGASDVCLWARMCMYVLNVCGCPIFTGGRQRKRYAGSKVSEDSNSCVLSSVSPLLIIYLLFVSSCSCIMCAILNRIRMSFCENWVVPGILAKTSGKYGGERRG